MAPHGYETDLFEDQAQLEAHLPICQICYDVPREALLHPRCGKSVCSECALYASEHGKPCGYCNEAFDLDAMHRNLDLRNLIAGAKVRCRTRLAPGDWMGAVEVCDWMGELCQLDNHMESCGFVTVDCRWKWLGCTHRMQRRQRSAHAEQHDEQHELLARAHVQALNAELDRSDQSLRDKMTQTEASAHVRGHSNPPAALQAALAADSSQDSRGEVEAEVEAVVEEAETTQPTASARKREREVEEHLDLDTACARLVGRVRDLHNCSKAVADAAEICELGEQLLQCLTQGSGDELERAARVARDAGVLGAVDRFMAYLSSSRQAARPSRGTAFGATAVPKAQAIVARLRKVLEGSEGVQLDLTD